jgi:hypothetical protein
MAAIRHIPTYGVFVIESMDEKNEREGNLNGSAICSILQLCGIPHEYIYIRTKLELQHAIEKFRKSDFGFLHISCHGSNDFLQLALQDVTFEELEPMLGPHLKYRRLFLSACEAACFNLAQHFIPKHHCYSIMGPSGPIDYDKAAIFWSAYYYLMYSNNQSRMWQKEIIPTLESITRTFQQSLNYFSIIVETNPMAKTHLREIHFQNGVKIHDKVKITSFENLYWEEALLNFRNQQRIAHG